jgi:hypothetical protein
MPGKTRPPLASVSNGRLLQITSRSLVKNVYDISVRGAEHSEADVLNRKDEPRRCFYFIRRYDCGVYKVM